MAADKTMAPKNFGEIAMWKKAAVPVGFIGGFALGYAIKKCMGCATGYGFAMAAVCSVPLGLDIYQLTAVPKTPTKPADKSSTPDPKTVAIMADMKALLGSDTQKIADFDKQSPQIQSAIGGLTDSEKSAFQEILTATKSSSAASASDPQSATAELLSKVDSITKKYTQPVMDSLNSKMASIEKQFGINV